MPKTQPFECDCGNPAMRRDNCGSPVCQRCSDMERTHRWDIQAFSESGVTDTSRKRSDYAYNQTEEMWENYYSDLFPPRMGESLKILELKLQEAA